MSDPVTEIRALMMQFEKCGLTDMFVRTKEWAIFMALPNGSANPLQAGQVAAQPSDSCEVSAPHLGLFEPCCAAGQSVTAGQVIARIDVLGRKTEVVSAKAGQLTAVHFLASDLVEFGEVLAEIAVA